MKGELVSVAQAKSIAESQAISDLGGFISIGDSVLDDEYMETSGCWLFFLNRRLKIPEGALLGINWAYAVSKKGRVSMVEDFPGDEVRRLDLLHKMSDFFKRVEG